MDRRERYESREVAIQAALRGQQADVWTALPGIIQSFDPLKLTCSVQPAIQAQLTSPVDGSQSWLSLPLLVDCPVFFPSGGGCTLTFPIVKGDECLVVFASRCIDAWWQSGGVQQQAEIRMHDLSDGFVFAGVRSVPRVIPTVSTTTVQLRSDDGLAYVEIHPTTHAMNVVAPGNLHVTAPTTTITGDVHVTGTLTADTEVIANGTHLHTHTHPDPQGGNTGAPNP